MMTTPTDDPQQRSTQQVFLILPLFSLIYGWFLPAGLFIYWITTTIFSIVQQFLIVGFGGLFPLFGWTPGFAQATRRGSPSKPFTPRSEPTSKQQAAAGGTARPPPPSARRLTARLALSSRPSGRQPARETPMSDYQEFTGKTVEEALRAAREALRGRRPRRPRFRDPHPGQPRGAGHGRRACTHHRGAHDRRWAARPPRRRPPQRSHSRHRVRRGMIVVRATATATAGPRDRAPSRRPFRSIAGARSGCCVADRSGSAPATESTPAAEPSMGANEHVPLRAPTPRQRRRATTAEAAAGTGSAAVGTTAAGRVSRSARSPRSRTPVRRSPPSARRSRLPRRPRRHSPRVPRSCTAGGAHGLPGQRRGLIG